MIKAIAYLLVEVPVQLVGLVINAIAIPFSKDDTNVENDGQAKIFTQYPQYGVWRRVRLPRWARWWDNPYDGLLGDKRGEWAKIRSGKHETFTSMYIWSALRNPANYFSRKVTGVDVSDCVICAIGGNSIEPDTTGASGKSWSHLVAVNSQGKTYSRFYGFYPITKKYGFSFNIGWKIKLEHNYTSPSAREQDRYKGNTFRISIITSKT